jgi:hypothetical protein
MVVSAMSRPPARAKERNVMDLDTPLRLDKAAALAFPDGSMKASGL